MTDQEIITTSQNWLSRFIIAHNICPFAHREQQNDTINYRICQTDNLELALETLMRECAELDAKSEIATSLVIYPQGFADFDTYLNLLEIAEQLLIDSGYEGIYQLASFHPQYCFEDSDPDDPANYTNRSPYPMLHIIREAALSEALTHYANPERIPLRNIDYTRRIGLEHWRQLLQSCFSQSTASSRDE